MSLERDFLKLAPQTVTIAPLSTTTLYGAPSYGTAVSYSASVQRRAQLVAGPDGREVTSRTQVFVMSSSASVSEQDRLTLGDGTTPRIIAVETWADDQGQHSVTVHCG